MTACVRREIELIAAWTLFILIVGAVFGRTQLMLLIGLVLYTVWHLYNLNQLTHWLSKPSKNTPDSSGVWDEVYYQLYHLHKRQRKSRKKLSSILTRFQKSTQALPYATIVLNDSDEIEWFNPAASHLFDFRSGYDIGQRIDNLIRQPVFASYLSSKDFVQPLKFQNNQRNILMNITPYGKGQYLLSARDNTQTSLLDEMRRDFISNASHELRTPLTVMSGYIEMLREREDDVISLPLQKIQKQTERMEAIISELIELAKLETATAVDKSTEIDATKLMNEIFNEALSLDQEQHQLSISLKPVKLYGNYAELRVAFSNLLTNAIRYTPEGREINLFTYTDETGSYVAVRDDGIGIDYTHIARLTERFYRVDEGRSREKGGTGLGLAIVKQILDRHGATLRIESVVGKGSVFHCYFPNVH